MKFFLSSESDAPSSPAIEKSRKKVLLLINEKIGATELAKLDMTFRYVPIIMPENMRKNYPERFIIHKKDKSYDCCPFLNYKIFIEEDFRAHITEYISGMSRGSSIVAEFSHHRLQEGDFLNFLSLIRNSILSH